VIPSTQKSLASFPAPHHSRHHVTAAELGVGVAGGEGWDCLYVPTPSLLPFSPASARSWGRDE
jgi:hypothetical protein